MRLTIEHTEKKKGFLKKTTEYRVSAIIEWTEEERAIVKERQLGKFVVWHEETDDEVIGNFDVNIDVLLPDKKKSSTNESGRGFDNPIQAQEWEAKVTQGIKDMKEFIYSNAEKLEGSKTIDL
jgi:hypothetical protein